MQTCDMQTGRNTGVFAHVKKKQKKKNKKISNKQFQQSNKLNVVHIKNQKIKTKMNDEIQQTKMNDEIQQTKKSKLKNQKH